ncbi:hypothetical protein SNE35_18685 [Paucibacter sp. R3-3]|uniref:Uncharacterized protein n=1 Tax=Roseateles agri TaxID=3098619 RepID=A0ABU5DNB4_9BURK|nr:hypothetical protein [Paucibacter sp. R3-3]MDY0746547.1 hypothetical protein [Paucibacter sp. R3-3]
MTVGEGIFWGAIVLALVGLYATTKDRWRWKRIAKWGVGVPAVLLVLCGLGVWLTNTYEARAKPLSTFGGITLASTEGDVRFAKGEPSKVLDEGLWVYYAGSGSANLDSAGYVVRFKAGKVRFIRYLAAPDQIVTPDLQGFGIGASYDHVLEKLGPASHVATSDDGLVRRLSYEKLKTFFTFEKAQIKDFGVYDPATGPLELSKPTSALAPAQSEAPPPQVSEAKPVLDHCAPSLSKAERMKRLAQHGTVRETGTGTFEAGERTISFGYDGALAYCR